MSNRLSSIPLILGIAMFLVLVGIRYERDRIAKLPKSVELIIVDRPVEIPGKVSRAKAGPVKAKDESRQALEDSLMRLARENGRLDSLAREALLVREATFEDTITVEDSLGSFYLRAIHKIRYDGALREMTKRTDYYDGKLTTVLIKEETYLKPTMLDIITEPIVWVIAVLTFALGVSL